eukprot:scaffold261_cov58-Cyclotella_meneghiniana.AAC.14
MRDGKRGESGTKSKPTKPARQVQNKQTMAARLHITRLLDVITQQLPETTFEFYSDAILGFAFLVTAIVAAKR